MKKTASETEPLTDVEFLEGWQLWRQALNRRDSPHSLTIQVENLCWNVATYEALMASWRSETAADGETLQVNSVLFHFITDNFTKSLCVDLRRLTEDGDLVRSPTSKTDRSAYSLQSLLWHCESQGTLHRRRLFLACKLEYDVAAIETRHWHFVLANHPDGGAYYVPAKLNALPSKFAHAQWDMLCCVSENHGVERWICWRPTILLSAVGGESNSKGSRVHSQQASYPCSDPWRACNQSKRKRRASTSRRLSN